MIRGQTTSNIQSEKPESDGSDTRDPVAPSRSPAGALRCGQIARERISIGVATLRPYGNCPIDNPRERRRTSGRAVRMLTRSLRA